MSKYELKLTKDEKSVLVTSLTAYLELLNGNLGSMFNLFTANDLSILAIENNEIVHELSNVIKKDLLFIDREPIENEVKTILEILNGNNKDILTLNELSVSRSALDSFVRFYMGEFIGALNNIEILGSKITDVDNEEVINKLKYAMFGFSPNHSYGIFSIDVPRKAKIGYQIIQAINNCGGFPFSEKSYMTATGDKEPIIVALY